MAARSHTSGHIETLDDLRPHLLDEIEALFRPSVELPAREMAASERGGVARAGASMEAGLAGAEAER